MKNKKSEKSKKQKASLKKRIISAVLVLVVLAFVACAVLSVFMEEGQTLGEFISEAMKKDAVKSEKFEFDAYSDNVFEELNGGLLAVSASAYQLLDSSGEIIGRGAKAFESPAVDVGAKGAVVWSQGGSEIMLISADGAAGSLDAAGSVISASINDSGYTAIAFEQSGYKGLVTVYNSSGEAIYKWYSGSGYLMDAAVNNSNTGMAALTVSGNGSRLVAYSLGSEEEQGAYTDSSAIYFDMDYISENRICAVSDNKAVFVNGKCEYNAEYSFDGWYLRDYSLDGSGFAVFVLSRYRSGGETMVVAVDSGGNVQGSASFSGDVSSISVRGRYIAVTCADSVVLYTGELKEVGREENTAGVEKALACANGRLIAVSANGAVEYAY